MILAIFWSLFALYSQFSKLITEKERNLYRYNTNKTAENISLTLRNGYIHMVNWKEFGYFDQFNETSKKFLKRVFEEQPSLFHHLSIMDKNGNVFYSYPENVHKRGDNLADLPHNSYVIKSKEPIISSPMKLIDDSWYVAVAVPIFRGNEFTGIFEGIISIDSFINDYYGLFQDDNNLVFFKSGDTYIECGKENFRKTSASEFEELKQKERYLFLEDKILLPTGEFSLFLMVDKSFSSKEFRKLIQKIAVITFFMIIVIIVLLNDIRRLSKEEREKELINAQLTNIHKLQEIYNYSVKNLVAENLFPELLKKVRSMTESEDVFIFRYIEEAEIFDNILPVSEESDNAFNTSALLLKRSFMEKLETQPGYSKYVIHSENLMARDKDSDIQNFVESEKYVLYPFFEGGTMWGIMVMPAVKEMKSPLLFELYQIINTVIHIKSYLLQIEQQNEELEELNSKYKEKEETLQEKNNTIWSILNFVQQIGKIRGYEDKITFLCNSIFSASLFISSEAYLWNNLKKITAAAYSHTIESEEKERIKGAENESAERFSVFFEKGLKVSRSYLITNNPEDNQEEKTTFEIISMLKNWKKEYSLAIPFYDSYDNVFGCLFVENPVKTLEISLETIKILEIYSDFLSMSIKKESEKEFLEQEIGRRTLELQAAYKEIETYNQQLAELVQQKVDIIKKQEFYLNNIMKMIDTYGILILGENKEITFWNKGFETVLGISSDIADEYAGKNYLDVFTELHTGFTESEIEDIRNLIRTGSEFEREFTILDKQGNKKTVVWSYQSYNLENQVGDAVIINDITKSKQLIGKIMEEEKQKAIILSGAEQQGIAITIVNVESYDFEKLLYFNKAFQAMMRMPGKRIAETKFRNFAADKDKSKLAKLFLNAQYNMNFADKLELEFITGEGEKIITNAAAKVSQYDGQRVVILFLTDITEELRHQEQTVQQQKMESIGRLAGGIAHDFNNILTSILGNTQIAQLMLQTSDEVKKNKMKNILDVIEKSSLRAKDLTQKLLGFSRQGKYAEKNVNINQIVTEALDIIKNTISKTIDIFVDLPENINLVKGDVTQLEQVIINLAINARDAMPQGGNLYIKTRNIRTEKKITLNMTEIPKGDYVMIQVTDTGSGIPEEIFSKMFEPFFTTKPKDKGTGMGLAMVYGIVQNHRGYVDVFNKTEGGACFTIYIPSHTVKTDSISDDSEITPTKTFISKEKEQRFIGRKVLVVDDEKSIRDFFKEVLSIWGMKIDATYSENSIRNFLSQNKYDMIFVDMIMPKLTGEEVVNIIRRQDKEVPIIIISGYSPKETINNLLMKQTQKFIAKPFKLEDIIEVMNEYIV